MAEPGPADGLVVVDTVTGLDRQGAGSVVVTGSHGGSYPGAVVAAVGPRAVIFNDAGVGADRAGVAALAELQAIGIPAAAVGHDTARIGDGHDTYRRGVIRHANPLARSLGCRPGLTCAQAARLLLAGPLPAPVRHPVAAGRYLLGAGPPEVWALDSASLATSLDRGRILVTGSHGALLGGRPATALKVDAAAALFNDAGLGIDDAGISRLPALARRGIAAATVSAAGARIGDARSTYADGVVSAVNRPAADLGARAGMTAYDLVALLVTRYQDRGDRDDRAAAR